MTFPDVVIECSRHRDFVSGFNRLTNSNFGQSLNRTALDKLIDETCGAPAEPDIAMFVAFVHDTVWTRLPRTT